MSYTEFEDLKPRKVSTVGNNLVVAELEDEGSRFVLTFHRTDEERRNLDVLIEFLVQARYELGGERDVFAFRSGPRRCEHLSCVDPDGYWDECKLAARDVLTDEVPA